MKYPMHFKKETSRCCSEITAAHCDFDFGLNYMEINDIINEPVKQIKRSLTFWLRKEEKKCKEHNYDLNFSMVLLLQLYKMFVTTDPAFYEQQTNCDEQW